MGRFSLSKTTNLANTNVGGNRMNDLHKIFKLTTVTVLITVGLFALTIISWDKFQEDEMLGCGTTGNLIDSVDPGYTTPPDHPGLQIFKDNCTACHRLDQKLVGPALRNAFASRDSIWFIKMIVNAKGLIATGDTLAARLYNEYQRSEHPDFRRLSKEDLTDLVEYLKLEGRRNPAVIYVD